MTIPEHDESLNTNQSPNEADRKIDKHATALIGLIGVVIVALVGLLQAVYETDRPINATTTAQTALAQLTQEVSGRLTEQAQVTQTTTATLIVTALIALPSPSTTTTMTHVPLPTLRPLPDPGWSEDQYKIFSVIQRELDSIIARDLSALQTIYLDDAVVVDKRGTPDDEADDLTYVGWDGIRQRYLKTFNYDWLKVTPINLQISVDHDTSFAVHEGILVNDDAYSRHVTYYELRRIGDEWRIARLEFDYR